MGVALVDCESDLPKTGVVGKSGVRRQNNRESRMKTGVVELFSENIVNDSVVLSCHLLVILSLIGKCRDQFFYHPSVDIRIIIPFRLCGIAA